MRAFAALSMLLACSGCALTATVAGLGKEPAGPADCRDDAALESWDSIVSGALAGSAGADGSGLVRLRAPTGVAARGNDIYIADAGQRAIIRYDYATRRVRKVIPIAELATDSALFLDRALALYVTFPASGRVVEFDLDDRPVRTFQDPAIDRPTAVVVDDARRQLLIADAASARIGVFDFNGRLVQAFGMGRSESETIAGASHLAIAPDQLFVADPILRQVHLLALDGTYRYAFGETQLGMPGPMAVDSFNRVHIADLEDGQIKTFRGGELIATTAGLRGGRAPTLQRIAALWASDGRLYVADPVSASVQVLRVVPPCPP